MTRKHYVALANALLSSRPKYLHTDEGSVWEATVAAVCDVLEKDNHAFNRAKWFKYLGLEY